MKKLLAHPLVILAITLVCGLLVFSMQKTAGKSRVSSDNISVMEQEVAELNTQLELEKQALEYGSSDLAKEKILRNELLLQRPGEYVIQIPDLDQVRNQTAETTAKTPWQEWSELLF